MEKRTLGRTDIRAAVVGFGGIPIQGLTFAAAEGVIRHALERGINFFDTARAYTDSEEKIGRALAGRRDEVYLASKSLAHDGPGMRRELEASLRALRTETIDLYQVHSVGSDEQLERVLGPGGAFEVLSRAREQGAVRWIGVTGHARGPLLRAARSGMFDTLQVPFNVIESEWADEVLPAARAAGVGTIGMKPLAGGALSSAEAAIRFALTGGIDVAIPGMDAVEQVEVNLRAGDLAPPGAEQRALLEEEKRLWGKSFCRRCGYCMPCPEGLNIPFLLLLEGYYTRYGLKEWAVARLETQEKSYSSCTRCGTCLERCPYHLPVPDLMERAASRFESR